VAGACHVERIDGDTVVVEAMAPIVAQELRLHGPELLAALAGSRGGSGIREIRVVVGRPADPPG
jgi:hypothetical protein